jgi:hypothetical protein
MTAECAETARSRFRPDARRPRSLRTPWSAAATIFTPAAQERHPKTSGRATDTLLSASKSTGAVRPDAGLPEVYAFLVGSCAAAAYAHVDDRAQSRALASIFDGLRGRKLQAP